MSILDCPRCSVGDSCLAHAERQATREEHLEEMIMSDAYPKSEREWWAKREIERLRERLQPPPVDDRLGWLQSYTGSRLYPAKPDPAHVDPRDMAHALSLICRFGGMVRESYSVAQHSILVSELAVRIDPGLALAGLLHDASEYVLGDVVRPLKRYLGERYADLERRWQGAVAERFGLDPALLEHPAVKLADNQALAIERRDLLGEALAADWEFLPEPPSLKGISQAVGNVYFGTKLGGTKLAPLSAALAEHEFLKRLGELLP